MTTDLLPRSAGTARPGFRVPGPATAIALVLSLTIGAVGLSGSRDAIAQSTELRTIYDEITRLYQARAFEKAIEITKVGIQRSTDEFGANHVATAALINNLAVFHKEVGQFEEAEPLYERALAIRQDKFGPNHLDVAQSLNNLAVLYLAMDRPEDAEPLYEEALAIREDNLDPYHPDVAQSLNNLAVLYASMDRNDEAEAYYGEALDLLAASGTDADLRLQRAALRNLAGLYEKQGRTDEATTLMAEADGLLPGDPKSLRRGDPVPPRQQPRRVEQAGKLAADPDVAEPDVAEPDVVEDVDAEGESDAVIVADVTMETEAGDGEPAMASEVTDSVAPPDNDPSASEGLVPEPTVDAGPEPEAAPKAVPGPQVASISATAARAALGLDLIDEARATVRKVNEDLAALKRSGRALDAELGTLPKAEIGGLKPAVAPGKPWQVQIGIYFKRKIADIWLKRVRARGYDAQLLEGVRNSGKVFYAVRFGAFAERDAAWQAARTFKRKESLEAMAVNDPPGLDGKL